MDEDKAATVPEPPAVALAGCGVDSGVMMARALARRRRIHPLYVRQGALWEDAEEAALRQFIAALEGGKTGGRLAPLHVMRLDLPDTYASRWALDRTIQPPGETSADEAVYLPGRNLALLFQGALLAQSLDVHTLLIGLLAGNPFSDAHPAFLRSFEQTYELATHYKIRVETPLGGLHKEEVIRLGAGLPLEFTFSCLRPVGGRHCGHCNKCAERQRGFAQAGVEDPTEYAGLEAK